MEAITLQIFVCEGQRAVQRFQGLNFVQGLGLATFFLQENTTDGDVLYKHLRGSSALINDAETLTILLLHTDQSDNTAHT